ncbi:MAG TPA: histone [Candidatus Hodarchaeales archaeon]|nr:histone [Candidatus Hodarchaeales archaeon]
MSKFADSQIEKLLRDAGADRVSADAIAKFNEILTEKALQIGRYAVDIARHDGRKTIKADDIKLSSQR